MFVNTPGYMHGDTPWYREHGGKYLVRRKYLSVYVRGSFCYLEIDLRRSWHDSFTIQLWTVRKPINWFRSKC